MQMPNFRPAHLTNQKQLIPSSKVVLTSMPVKRALMLKLGKRHMKSLTTGAIFAFLVASAQPAFAQDSAGRVIYIGMGSQTDTASETADETPFSIGVYAKPGDGPFLFGLDYGREGAMLDSTYGSDEIRMANSFNLLVGTSLMEGQHVTVDALLMVGMRESVSDCPDSYLGYQCYADTAPDTSYEANFGAVVMTSFESFAVGVRATSESTQLSVGLAF